MSRGSLLTLSRLLHRRRSIEKRPREAAPNTLAGSGVGTVSRPTLRKRVASAPQKIVRTTQPASQNGGLTSAEGPSSLAAQRVGSLAAKAQQVASRMSAGPGRGPIKARGSGWAKRRTEACGVGAPESTSLSASSVALVLHGPSSATGSPNRAGVVRGQSIVSLLRPAFFRRPTPSPRLRCWAAEKGGTL